MGKPKWEKQVLRLQPNHTWRCKPGYKVFVAGRGDVRFDVPSDWVIEPGEGSVKFFNLPPPDDDCRIEVSYLKLNPRIDWRGLSLRQLFEQAIIPGEQHKAHTRSSLIYQRRPDLELIWQQIHFLDTNEWREACSRACLARGANVQPLITLDYWLDDAPRFEPVWDEVLRSLQLGQYVQDPTRGRVVN
jgi:hypothetical protein